jgi:hypothetical protein
MFYEAQADVAVQADGMGAVQLAFTELARQLQAMAATTRRRDTGERRRGMMAERLVRVIQIDNCDECPARYHGEEGGEWCWLSEDDGPAQIEDCPLKTTDVILTSQIMRIVAGERDGTDTAK